MDEHRLGLHPVLRRVWFNRWHGSPIAPVHSRYEWSWLYGFVHPHSGETYWWLLPWVNIDLFNRVLADVAQHFELGANRRMVLVMDQAGWHTSKRVEVPEGMHLVFLPPYSPHMQPAERLWPIVNEGIANQVFETLDALLERVAQRCVELLKLPDFISGLTRFHWWEAFQC
jgi:hypothetical protein